MNTMNAQYDTETIVRNLISDALVNGCDGDGYEDMNYYMLGYGLADNGWELRFATIAGDTIVTKIGEFDKGTKLLGAIIDPNTKLATLIA